MRSNGRADDLRASHPQATVLANRVGLWGHETAARPVGILSSGRSTSSSRPRERRSLDRPGDADRRMRVGNALSRTSPKFWNACVTADSQRWNDGRERRERSRSRFLLVHRPAQLDTAQRDARVLWLEISTRNEEGDGGGRILEAIEVPLPLPACCFARTSREALRSDIPRLCAWPSSSTATDHAFLIAYGGRGEPTRARGRAGVADRRGGRGLGRGRRLPRLSPIHRDRHAVERRLPPSDRADLCTALSRDRRPSVSAAEVAVRDA